MTLKRPELGKILKDNARLWPSKMPTAEKLRIISKVDRSFAALTGQAAPEPYTETTPQNRRLLIPAVEDDAYHFAILWKTVGSDHRDAQAQYLQRYEYHLHAAAALYADEQKGDQDGTETFFR